MVLKEAAISRVEFSIVYCDFIFGEKGFFNEELQKINHNKNIGSYIYGGVTFLQINCMKFTDGSSNRYLIIFYIFHHIEG
jgi:hypothetical protein